MPTNDPQHIPEEAVEAAMIKAGEHIADYAKMPYIERVTLRRNLTEVLRAALPALRSEWEKELLSDEAIKAADKEIDWVWAYYSASNPGLTKEALEAALSATKGES